MKKYQINNNYNNFIEKYKSDLDSKKSLCKLINTSEDIDLLIKATKEGYNEVAVSIHEGNANFEYLEKKIRGAADSVTMGGASFNIFTHGNKGGDLQVSTESDTIGGGHLNEDVLRALSKACLYKNSFWLHKNNIHKANDGKADKVIPIDRPKIGILTVGWKRRILTRKYCESISLLRSSLKDEAEILPILVDSEGHNRDSCEEFSIPYFEYQNRPLSNKFNYAMQNYREKSVDGVIIMGTDNFFSEDLLKEYVKISRNKYDLAGALDSYIYNNIDDKMYHFKGYIKKRIGETLGAGRFLANSLLKKLDFTPWGEGLNRNLDGSMWDKLKPLNLKEYKIQVKENSFMLLGIKTDVFLTDVKKITAKEEVDKKYIKKINVFNKELVKKGGFL